MRGTSVERPDCGSNADGTAGEYVGAQTATVDQAAEDALSSEPFQVPTGFAQPLPQAFHIANAEAAPHQRVEVDAASNDVAPRLRVAQAAILIEQQVIKDLRLNECEVVARPDSVRRSEGSRLGGVAVTRDPAAGDGLCRLDQVHWPGGYFSQRQRLDVPVQLWQTDPCGQGGVEAGQHIALLY